MPIAASELEYRLSGGAANASPLTSLGGAISTTATAGTNIYDDVTSAEALSGRVEYRCIYYKNNNVSLTLYGAVAWLSSNTPNTSTDIAIGLGTSSQGGTEQSVANETTAPAGVTFTSPSTKATGVLLGDIPPGGWRAIWLRRTVSAGAAAIASDPFTVRVEGDTN